VVDLPAPFGPRKPGTIPGWTWNERSSTASFSLYRLLSPLASIPTASELDAYVDA
jgi:hypothetical protein